MPRQCPNPKCHAIVSDVAQFCPNCGTSIAASSKEVEPALPSSLRKKQKKTLRPKIGQILLFLFATSLTWYLSLAIAYISNSPPPSPQDAWIVLFIIFSIDSLAIYFLSRISSKKTFGDWFQYFVYFGLIVGSSAYLGGEYQYFGYSLIAAALVIAIGLPLFLKVDWSKKWQKRGVYRGQISSLQGEQVTDSSLWSGRTSIQQLSFILLHTDEKGNPLPSLPVIIRARAISGVLRNGDEVEVRGQLVRGSLYARELKNLSTAGASLIIKGWLGSP